MATPAEYLAQAEQNERFADTLAGLPERFTGWEVTALFYAALHYVNAFLAAHDEEPEFHRQRNKLVGDMTNAQDDYRMLYEESINSRYLLAAFTPRQVAELRAGPFHRVKTEMLQRLAP